MHEGSAWLGYTIERFFSFITPSQAKARQLSYLPAGRQERLGKRSLPQTFSLNTAPPFAALMPMSDKGVVRPHETLEPQARALSVIQNRLADLLEHRRSDLLALLGSYDFVEQCPTFDELAQEIIPDTHGRNVEIARRVMSLAVRSVAAHRYEPIRVKSQSHGRGGFAHSTKIVRDAVEAQGKHMLTPEQKTKLKELMRSIVYPEGDRHAGQPNCTLIAEAMNSFFSVEVFNRGKISKNISRIRKEELQEVEIRGLIQVA